MTAVMLPKVANNQTLPLIINDYVCKIATIYFN